MFRKHLIWGWMALLILACITQGQPQEARIREWKPVWDSALSFRQMSLTDYRKALEACAASEAKEQFRALDETVWGDIDPVQGWSFFMNTSVLAIASLEGPVPLVAFYHPFSDVFLLTAWEVRNGRGVITDSDVFMGDWLRGRAKLPFNLMPLWRRGKTFPPAALGQAVAESVKSLEDIFKEWTGTDWRRRIGEGPERARAKDINRAGAAVTLALSLRGVDVFAIPEPKESEMLGALRVELALALNQIVGGGLEKALSAADLTLPLMKALLRQIPADTFKKMFVAGTVVGTSDAVAIMAPTYDADYCLGFYFTGTPDDLRLRRMDIVYYPGWYKYAVEARLGAGAGR